jgi:16S rRNA (cytosine1402-N4)-methyltransferase
MRSADLHEGEQELTETPRFELDNPHVAHIPVLLHEAIDLLAPKPGGVYVDGTLGAGGHAAEILKRSAPDGILIGMDQDEEAVARCKKNLAVFGSRCIVRHADFRDMQGVLAETGHDAVDGVLLDLGMSWFHVKMPERGFSFILDGPLDMRMNKRAPRTAADLVNTLSREELATILREYGEEQRAGAIATAIIRARVKKPFTSTVQLAEVVSSAYPPFPPRRIHPATLTFQALRIAVNDELTSLRNGLADGIAALTNGGRIAVISFHSLEDRIVKQAFVKEAKGCICPPKLPVCACGKKPALKILTSRPLLAGVDEVRANPASRSAKLRAAEKLAPRDEQERQSR